MNVHCRQGLETTLLYGRRLLYISCSWLEASLPLLSSLLIVSRVAMSKGTISLIAGLGVEDEVASKVWRHLVACFRAILQADWYVQRRPKE